MDGEAPGGVPGVVPVDVAAAARHVRGRLRARPRCAIVLGSGLGHLADEVADPLVVPFEEVPGMPASTVVGHAGRWVAGRLGGVDVLLQDGRYHLYEGHTVEVVVAPVRIAAALGAGILVATNAAGGIRPDTRPGDLILLDDHLDFQHRAPLAGPVREGEARFPDMSAPYDPDLQAAARAAAARVGVEVSRGTYAAVLGPQFETAAEIRMLARLGADVVGMSTVPEVIAARAAGLRCLGFSVVTNRATGLAGEPLAHDHVLEVGRAAGRRLGRILIAWLREVGAQSEGAK